MEKLKNILELTVYNKGGQTWYCDYYFYNGRTYGQGTTKAAGWGYDKHSTALSNAINKFMYLFKLKRGVKWESPNSGHSQIKNKTYYGLYNFNNYLFIDYGIGASSVINCLGLFSNVKLKEAHYGKYEDFFKIEFETTAEDLQKKIEKNEKRAAKKNLNKDEKKRLQNENKKLLEAINWSN